jgi:peptide/nickel transport system substrate-binding protein
MKRRNVGTGVLASIVLLLATACTSGDEGGGRATDPDAALRGGTLRVGVENDDALDIDLDPANYGLGVAWELPRCCLSRTLYSYNGKPAEEGGAEARPDLAQGMPEVSNDGLTWTFRLKPGIRYAPPFEDTTIVAEDIVRALEREAHALMTRAKDDNYGDYIYGDLYYSVIRGFDDYPEEAPSIVGLETPDERTLVVRLTEVAGDLPYRFALPATAPIPEGASEGHDRDYGRFLVASGPYMVEGSEDLDFSAPPREQEPASGFVPATLNDDGDVEPGSLVLVRNPSWDPETDELRPAYPDRIEIAIGGGDAEYFADRVDAAEIDLVIGYSGSPFEQVARYQEDPALEDRLHVHPVDEGWAITMNLAMPPFDDVHVRRAVNHAIDKAALVDLLSEPPYGSRGNAAAFPGAHIAPDHLEGLLLREFDPYPYDPAAAREEMRASAYDPTGDGVCDVQACRNVRALVVEFAVHELQAEAVRADLAEIGIELELEIQRPEQFFAFPGGNEDPRNQFPMIMTFPWGADFPEGIGWFGGLFDDSGLWEGCCNTSLLGASPRQLRSWGYRVRPVPSVDDRFEACQQRRGVARTQCWAEYDQYLMNEVVPRVPYMYLESALVVSERVTGYSFDQWTGLPALDQIALAPGSD